MKQTVNETAFIQAFIDMDRVNNFEVDGLRCLYEYLTDMEDDTGEEMELDVIMLCCDFDRWESLEDCASNYDVDLDVIEDATDLEEFVCWIDDGPAFITYAH